VPKASLRLDARPWNVKASTRCGYEVVLALVPFWRTWLCHLSGSDSSLLGSSCLVGWHSRSSTMGQLGVKDIATPEVKFLDRCKINCSEGVLQVLVRRSRMWVWGAKMIRHRR